MNDYDDIDYDILPEYDEDIGSRLERAYRERTLRKVTNSGKRSKLPRVRSEKYDPNASGMPARSHKDDKLGFRVKYTGLKDLPVDEKAINELANEMMAWAAKEDAFKLEDFPLMKQYSPYKFFKLAEKHAYFAQALDYANHLIGSRLQHKLVYEGINPQYAMKMLPLYHYHYKQWELEKRAQKDHAKNQTIVAVLPEWATSPEVLEKAKKKKVQEDE